MIKEIDTSNIYEQYLSMLGLAVDFILYHCILEASHQ